MLIFFAQVCCSHVCSPSPYFVALWDGFTGSCATIFSASNYGGSMNQGATMRFSLIEEANSLIAGGERYGFAVTVCVGFVPLKPLLRNLVHAGGSISTVECLFFLRDNYIFDCS